MVDQNTFINTYIDIVVNSLTDQIKSNLQLQTQVKVNELVVADKDQIISSIAANKDQIISSTVAEKDQIISSTVAEKDQIISSLTTQLNENKVAENWKVKYEASETNYASVLAKLSHMDTLLAQIVDMKKIILEKDKEIEELKSPKKVINTKITKTKEEPLSIVKEEKTEKKTDDF
jgi:hypothetical protein